MTAQQRLSTSPIYDTNTGPQKHSNQATTAPSLHSRFLRLLIGAIAFSAVIPIVFLHIKPPPAPAATSTPRWTSSHLATIGRQAGRQKASTVPVFLVPPNISKIPKWKLPPFLLDGVSKSTRLHLAQAPEEKGVIWIVDLVYVECEELIRLAQTTLERRMHNWRIEKGAAAAAASRLSRDRNSIPTDIEHAQVEAAAKSRFTNDIQWTVIVVDWTNYGYVLDDDKFFNFDDLAETCLRPLADLVGKNHVRFAAKSHAPSRDIVTHQHAKKGGTASTFSNDEAETLPFHDLGVEVKYDALYGNNFINGKVRQVWNGVNSTHVQVIQQEFIRRHHPLQQNNNGVSLITMPRPMDVIHFWKIGWDLAHGLNGDRVGLSLQTLGIERGYKVTIDDVGDWGKENWTPEEYKRYVDALLNYKIVVISQADDFEGSMRLMESLVAGAMVLMDPMVHFPLFLKGDESLVVYHSIADLKEKVTYYLEHDNERLAIAAKGREVAMEHHQSWHFVERLVFGNWSTTNGL